MLNTGAYKKVVFRGKRFNKRTAAALLAAEKRLGYELTVYQGSYNSTTSASAGTHDRGGAVDLAPADSTRKVLVLRRIGFAAWYRPQSSSWVGHVHAGLIGDREASTDLKDQFDEYRIGYDGLAGDGRDTLWRPSPQIIFPYYTWRRNNPDLAKVLDSLPAG